MHQCISIVTNRTQKYSDDALLFIVINIIANHERKKVDGALCNVL